MFSDWYDRTVTVDGGTTYTDDGAQIPGQPVDVPCRIEENVQLVRTPAGEQTVSSATLFAALDHAAVFTTDTPVRWSSPAGERAGQVITCAVETSDPDLAGITVYVT